MNPYEMSFDQRMAIDAAASERLAFIRRTYLHVAGALAALAGVLAFLVAFVPDEVLLTLWGQSRGLGMLLIFGGFLAATWAANRMAQSDMPVGTQYLGLGLMVAAYAFILWPGVWLASTQLQYEGVLGQAVILTLALAGGLTAGVFITKKDFSFLGPTLGVISFLVIGVMVAGLIFNFSLGLWFSLAMIALLAAFILYDTSMVMHRYRTNQHVAASLAIFSSVATLFVWILDILMRNRN